MKIINLLIKYIRYNYILRSAYKCIFLNQFNIYKINVYTYMLCINNVVGTNQNQLFELKDF